jgi:uncharacterized membrane protein YjjB (DUF3815 family)
MDLPAILLSSLWAALFATGLGVRLTAPVRFLIPTFVCGFVGRGVRDIWMAGGLSQNWATLIAAAVVVVVAGLLIRGHTVSPVVLVCGVLPLGATVAMFNLILALTQLSSLTGEALTAASVALNANLGKVFTTSLAIVLGLAAGLVIVRLFRREDPVAV